MLAFPAWTLYRARLVPGESVQPRYLLPVIPLLLVLLLTSRKPWRSISLSRPQAWIVWAMLSIAHAAALYTEARRYVTGFDDPVIMDHVEWWWPNVPSPYVTCILGAVGSRCLPRRSSPSLARGQCRLRGPEPLRRRGGRPSSPPR